MKNQSMLERIWPFIPILAALVVTSLLLIVVGSSPGLVFSAMFDGAFGNADRTLNTMAFWVPLLLCATGLLVTFTAGLWNIGVEGQMVMGAVGASWIALKVAVVFPELPSIIIVPLEIIAAMAFGAFWAALAGILKIRGGVHEIFGGVALNSLAIISANYLISGPWQPPEGGSFRGTDPFPDSALMPLYGESQFSPLSLALAMLLFGLVAYMLRETSWGLKLKALGKNMKASFLIGIPSDRELLGAMIVCGALAGLAGSVRVLSWFDSLRQSVSGGIGFLAILIVLLAGIRPLWTLFIALIFSALLNGGTLVQLRTQLHSSLSGIIQGLLVLFALLFGNYKQIFRKTTSEEKAHE